jgi:alkylation response protein AidB-like acyl-CoA dehydrogenase
VENEMPDEEHNIRNRVKQFVEEELNPISQQVETSGEIPEEIVEKMRVLDKGRLTMGACALGASKKLLDLSIAHVRLYRIFEGTSEIQRMVISRNLLRK